MKVYLVEIGAYAQGSSTSSLAIGTGSKTFTLEEHQPFVAGMTVTAVFDDSNDMEGTVTSYDRDTLQLVVNVTAINGSGTRASWIIGGETTLRFASDPGYNHPSAPGYYESRLVQPAGIGRAAFGPGRVGGPIEATAGECTIANADGGVDDLKLYGYEHRDFVMLSGDSDDDYGDFTTELSAIVELPAVQNDLIIFHLLDGLAALEKPVNETKYAGDNSGSPLAGVEGTEDNIKGKPKPRLYGVVKDADPPCVNTDKQIYQLNDGALQSIDAVYVGGLALSAGAAYASQADMEATAPSAGQYRVWLAGGMFRLGSSPTGIVTADASEGANDAARTVAQVLKRLATLPNAIDAARVSAADVTALDVDTSAVVGIWIKEEMRIIDAMNLVAAGAAAWFGMDRMNDLRMKRLEAPSGSPAVIFQSLDVDGVATEETVDLIDFQLVPNAEEDLSVPAWRVVVQYAPCWTPQPTGFDETISDERKAFLKEGTRQVTWEDAAVKTKHPGAREIHVTTTLRDEADAQALADYLGTLFGVIRDLWELQAKWTPELAALVDLGTITELLIERYGYDAGRSMVAVAIDRDTAEELATINVWG